MTIKYVITFLLIKTICCSSETNVRKARSSSTSATTARFNLLTGDFDDDNSPENYFPEMEYPSDILQLSRPYYFKATSDDVLEPFPRDVKDSYRYVSTGAKNDNENIEENNANRNKKEFLNNLLKQTNDIVKRINLVRLNNKLKPKIQIQNSKMFIPTETYVGSQENVNSDEYNLATAQPFDYE